MAGIFRFLCLLSGLTVLSIASAFILYLGTTGLLSTWIAMESNTINTAPETRAFGIMSSNTKALNDVDMDGVKQSIRRVRVGRPYLDDNKENMNPRDRTRMKYRNRMRGTFARNPSKRWKEGYKYCDISNVSSVSTLFQQRNQNISQLTAARIEELKQQRLQKPKACQTSREHPSYLRKRQEDLDKTHNNLVPYINRCKVLGYGTQPDLFEYYGGPETRAAYIHVFKSGGTTVIKTWENMRKMFGWDGPGQAMKVHWRTWNKYGGGPPEYRWMGSRSRFYSLFDAQYSFSYVRDPVSRFVSGFFEHTVRANDDVEGLYMQREQDEDKSPLHLLHTLANIMRHRMICEYTDNQSEDDRVGQRRWQRQPSRREGPKLPNPLHIYWDDHLNPQMHFLLNDRWEPYKLNYVGHVDEIEETIYKILMEFSHLKPRELTMQEFQRRNIYERTRDRHSKQYQRTGMNRRYSERHFKEDDLNVQDLVIEEQELDSELIQLICELYWLDYICLPFDVPPQCNLTDLFLQHYGTHVVYNDCYE